MWDLKCIAAALCFFTSNILWVVHGALLMNSGSSYTQSSNAIGSSANPYDPYKENDPVKPMNYNSEYWKDLDPDYIESRWVARGEQVSEYFCSYYTCCVMPFYVLQ